MIRHDADTSVNVNDEIGLDPFLDYTLAEHLEDLAGDGLRLVATCGNMHLFSDESIMLLEEKQEAINLSRLDETTKFLVLSAAAHVPAQTARLALMAC